MPERPSCAGHVVPTVKITENCLVCGFPVQYTEQAFEAECFYCKKIDLGHIKCPNGHYVCEECHNRDFFKTIEQVSSSTESKDPIEIAESMMELPDLPMLGCHHAYIAGGALMAAIRNEGSIKIAGWHIKEVFMRTGRQAHGGYCGLTGVCGIAVAIGACFAVITGSRCGVDMEQRLTMTAVTRVMRVIAGLTGPSCCKAYVRSGLEEAVCILKEDMGVHLPISKVAACAHVHRHPHGCRMGRCPYFKT